MKKKVVLVVLAIVMICTFVFPVSAESPHLVRQRVIDVAKVWAKSAYEDSVSIKDVIEMCDCDDNTIGYCISYKHGNQDMGYIVIDINRPVEECIVEYCLEGENIYYSLLENAEKKSNGRALGHGLKIYCYQPFAYAIAVEEDGNSLYYTSTGEALSESSFKENSISNSTIVDKVSIYSGIVNAADVFLSEIVSTDVINGTLSNLTPITTDEFGDYENNCGPTALTNVIIIYYQLYNKTDLYRSNNLEWTYDRLVAWLEVKGYYTPETGTSREGYSYALTNYVHEQSANYYVECSPFPTSYMSEFVEEFGRNFPVLTSITSGEGEDAVGHAVVAIGYVTRASGNTLFRYLRVLDGWNHTTQRYLNYDYYDEIIGRTARIL